MITTVKEKIIAVDTHAFYRTVERGIKFGLDYYETRSRVFQTVREGHLSIRKHLSKIHKTYHKYFNDNISFYVVCKEKEYKDCIKCLIKTIIIEVGRE